MHASSDPGQATVFRRYPCGFLGDTKEECICTLAQIQRYRSRVSAS